MRSVAGKPETTLLVRRRPPSEPEEPYRNAVARGCPPLTFFRVRVVSGASLGKNVKDGTPGEHHGLAFPGVIPVTDTAAVPAAKVSRRQ